MGSVEPKILPICPFILRSMIPRENIVFRALSTVKSLTGLGSVHKWCPILGGAGGSKMTPKNRIKEGKNRIKGWRGGQKWLKKIGHHLCTLPYKKEHPQIKCRGSQQRGVFKQTLEQIVLSTIHYLNTTDQCQCFTVWLLGIPFYM